MQSLGREDPLEKEMANHSSTLAWKIPGKSHGQRSLVGYSPWGPRQLDTTEQLHFLSFTFSRGSSQPRERTQVSCKEL